MCYILTTTCGECFYATSHKLVLCKGSTPKKVCSNRRVRETFNDPGNLFVHSGKDVALDLTSIVKTVEALNTCVDCAAYPVSV